MDRAALEAAIAEKKERLQLYYTREKEMLSSAGVQSYGIGTRNVARFNTGLKDIQDKIAALEKEISELEGRLYDRSPRKAAAVVPRDW